MKERADLVRGWLRKAKSDEMAMEASFQTGALDAACFHAQQAAEKYLKAFLTHATVTFPYTHNLAKLVELCSGQEPSARSLLPCAELLTPYAVEARYDLEFWPSVAATEEARACSRTVGEFVVRRLPREVTCQPDPR